jgi:hypothetical protein
MPDLQTAEEAAQIEHELKILRTRHAQMVRWAPVKRFLFALGLRVSATALAGTLVFTLGAVIGIGVLIIGTCAIAAGAIWLFRGPRAQARTRPHRRAHIAIAFEGLLHSKPEKQG